MGGSVVSQDDIRTIEIRCTAVSGWFDRKDNKPKETSCNKLAAKLKVYLTIPEQIKEIMKEKKQFLSQAGGIEIKVGSEVFCNRCKKMSYSVTVI